MTFKNCTTPLRITGGSSHVISSCDFIDNGHGINGGSIFISLSNVSIFNSSFHSNSAQLGGAIYSENSTLQFSQLSFFNNTAANYGGALYDSRSTMNCTDCNFTQNEASFSAGGVYLQESQAKFKGGVGNNNHARNGAGGFIVAFSAQIEMNDMELTNNTAEQTIGGGAICIVGNTLTPSLLMENVRCKYNSGFVGGCLLLRVPGLAYIYGSVFESNSADMSNGGGAIFANGVNVTIESSKIIDNNAYAVYLENGLSI